MPDTLSPLETLSTVCEAHLNLLDADDLPGYTESDRLRLARQAEEDILLLEEHIRAHGNRWE